MTEAPTRVRAVARVDPQAPAPATAPRLKPRPGYFGPVHLLQLFLAQAALLGTAVALIYGWLVTAVVVVPATLVILAVLLRIRGRWWYERRSIARQYRRRRRSGRPEPDVEPRLAALRGLAPGLTVHDVDAPDGTPIGVACDAAGWYAVAAIGTDDTMLGERGPGVPLDVLARALDEVTHPGSVLQVVTQSVAAPSPHLDARHLAARSYHELHGRLGVIPADRLTWVAIRLEARTRAELGLPGGQDAEHAPAELAALARKVSRSLRDNKVPHRLLAADGVVAALTRACGLDEATIGPAGPPGEPAGPPVREEWTVWRCGALGHTTFWVRDWPENPGPAALLELVNAVPASSTLSLALVGDGTGYALRGLVRLTAPVAVLAGLGGELQRAVRGVGGRLSRLDGEHAPATYASAPTGGGAK